MVVDMLRTALAEDSQAEEQAAFTELPTALRMASMVMDFIALSGSL